VALSANYWRAWGAAAVSNLGDGVFQVALPLLAVSLTRSPTQIAGVAIAARVPWLVMALVAGALADRLDRRRTMVRVDLIRGVLLAGLAVAVAADAASMPLLYALALALGFAETLFDTASQSLMPALVESDDLSKANGRLYAAELVTNQFIGPPIGGLLAASALALAFGLTAAGYLLAAVALLTLTGTFRPQRTGPPTRLRADIAEGVRFVWHHSVLRTLGIMLGVWNMASTAAGAVFVLYAVEPGPMQLSAASFGVLLTTGAIGGIIGSWVAPRLERSLGRRATLALCVATGGSMALVPALTTSPVAVGASFVMAGVAGVAWNVITVSLRQRITPDHLLGRMNSVYRLLGWGTIPVGALLGGVLADTVGLRWVFVVDAALTLSLLLGFSRLTEDRLSSNMMEE
jgi:MFS family permease